MTKASQAAMGIAMAGGLLALSACASSGGAYGPGDPTPYVNGTMYKFGTTLDGYRLVRYEPDRSKNYCHTERRQTEWGVEKHEECGITEDKVGYGSCLVTRYRWQDGRSKYVYIDNPCTLEVMASDDFFMLNRPGQGGVRIVQPGVSVSRPSVDARQRNTVSRNRVRRNQGIDTNTPTSSSDGATHEEF